MSHSAGGQACPLSREPCCPEGRGACFSPSPAQAPNPAALGPSETQGSALFALPEPSSLVWGTEGKPRGRKGRCGRRGAGSAGAALGPALPVHRLVPWARDPAGPGKTASQQDHPSFKYGSFFFPFSSTSARALSLSLSPPLPPLPVPPHPKCSLCSAGPRCGLTVSGPSGGVPRCPASFGQPSTVCLVACVHVCVRVPGKAANSCARGLWRFPSLLPFLLPSSVLRPPSVPCPSSIQLKGSLTLFSCAETVRGALLPGPHCALLFPTALPQHPGPEGVHALQRPQAQDQ